MKVKRNKIRGYIGAATLIVMIVTNNVIIAQNGSFRGDNQNSGFYNSENQNFTFTKWKFKTQGMIFSTPLVSGEMLYVGSNDSSLYAINKHSGELIWKYKTGGPITSSPAVHDSMVYFLSMDGNMYANHVTTGAELWRFATKGEYKRQVMGIMGRLPNDTYSPEYWDFYLSSPKVADSLLFFGSSDSSVYALNRHSGQLVWSKATGNGNHTTPAFYDNKIFCGSWDSKIYAFDAFTGDTIWTYQTGLDERQHLMTGIQASPSVSDGIVYITSRDAKCYALDSDTGELIWESNFGSSWLPSSPSFDDSFLYFGSSDAMKLYCVDKNTGNSKYEQTTNFYCFSSPAITNHKLYEGLFNGRVQTYEKLSGHLLSEFQSALSIKNFLGLQNGDGSFNINPMYNGIDYNYVSADSLYLDRLFQLGAFISSPITTDGVIYITSTDSTIYALQSTQLEYSDSIYLGSVYTDSIVPIQVEFSVAEAEYDSVTIVVKSKFSSYINSISNISSSSQIQIGDELTVTAMLHSQAFSVGSWQLPLYLDFWQDGDRHRAIVDLHFEIEGHVRVTPPPTKEIGIDCYPNPSSDELHIQIELKESNVIEIFILNTAGIPVYQDKIGLLHAGIQNYTLSDKLPQGMYTIIVRGTEAHATQNVIIAK